MVNTYPAGNLPSSPVVSYSPRTFAARLARRGHRGNSFFTIWG